MKDVINKLIELDKTISTMESCTGGCLANEITNIEDSSMVFKYGAVTYSNEYKIKMGVSKDIIDKYTVYSMETANEMSKVISNYTNSDYGIGITGKLNKEDVYNDTNTNNIVYVSIYEKDNNRFYNQTITVSSMDRKLNKELIVKIIINMLKDILK
ncbi:MAG TPA: nicotinamide-nucleotide amidohydrolase family protein [Bacilli bacterium]|nr:nicotinamide-nucleotide amidohydrolase family protein [Bacilli bacterium]